MSKMMIAPIGAQYGPMLISFPQSDRFKCFFEKPLPCGHGSVESVRYRAVTARERSFNHGISRDAGKLSGIVRNILCLTLLCITSLQAATKPNAETLRYQLNWPSGISLGEAQLKTIPTEGNWKLELTMDASIPGFQVLDRFNATLNAALCSVEFSRTAAHGNRKSKETTTFDLAAANAQRKTDGGGTTEFSTNSCPHDALGFLFYARQELISGRVPPAQMVYYGGPYDVQFELMGTQLIPIGGTPTNSDKYRVSFKGAASKATFEIFFARNESRTPVLFRVPFSLGTFSMELVP